MPDGEVYRGHDGVVKAMTRWRAAFEDAHLEVDELIEVGDTVVVLFRETGRGRASGAATEHRFAGVWEFRDGRVHRVTPYHEREDALRAAGLR